MDIYIYIDRHVYVQINENPCKLIAQGLSSVSVWWRIFVTTSDWALYGNIPGSRSFVYAYFNFVSVAILDQGILRLTSDIRKCSVAEIMSSFVRTNPTERRKCDKDISVTALQNCIQQYTEFEKNSWPQLLVFQAEQVADRGRVCIT